MINKISNIFFFAKPNKIKFLLVAVCYCVLILLIGIPGFLLQKILSPVVKLRVCIFPTNYIGHMIYEFENFSNFHTKNGFDLNVDLFCAQPNIANMYIFNKIKNELRFFPRVVIIPIVIVNRIFRCKKFIIELSKSHILSNASEIYTLPVKFRFTEHEVKYGDELLRQLGWDSSKKLITLFFRDVNFRMKFLSNSNADKTAFRDVKSESYAGLISELKHSYFIQQLGLDYLYLNYPKFSKQEIEFLNTYAAYRSSLSITTDSGSSLIPFMFRTPTIQTNLSLTSILQGVPGKLVVPLIYYDLISGRKIPLSELIDRKIYMVTENSKFKLLGLEVIQASFSDLEDLHEEIDELMNGTWQHNQLNLNLKSTIISKYEKEFPNILHTNYSNNWIQKNAWYFQ